MLLRFNCLVFFAEWSYVCVSIHGIEKRKMYDNSHQYLLAYFPGLRCCIPASRRSHRADGRRACGIAVRGAAHDGVPLVNAQVARSTTTARRGRLALPRGHEGRVTLQTAQLESAVEKMQDDCYASGYEAVEEAKNLMEERAKAKKDG